MDHGLGQVTECQRQPTQVRGTSGCIGPVFQAKPEIQRSLHGCDGLLQPTQSSQVEAGFVQDIALVRIRQTTSKSVPGPVEEARESGQIGTQGTQLVRAVSLAPALYTPEVD